MATTSAFLSSTSTKAEKPSGKISTRIPVKLLWRDGHLVFVFPKEYVKAYGLGADWNTAEISRCSGGFVIHINAKGGLF